MRTQAYKRNLSAILLTGFCTATGLLLGSANVALAQTIFRDDFTNLTWDTGWTRSDPGSVYTTSGEYLFIGGNGTDNDQAEKVIHVDLSAGNPVVIDLRLKLESVGEHYRLPWERISFEDSSQLEISYLPKLLPSEHFGWAFGFGDGPWTDNYDHAVPGEGYWAVTRIVLTPTGGELFVKPDDTANGWVDDNYYSVASANWSHSSIESINLSQPWDSVNYFDYVVVTIPEPATFSLLALGGLLLFRRRKN